MHPRMTQGPCGTSPGLYGPSYAPQVMPARRGMSQLGACTAAARRARDPDAKFGGQRKPKRRDPGDDIWDNTDDFVWKDVLEKAENEDDMSSGFVVDEKGVLSLM